MKALLDTEMNYLKKNSLQDERKITAMWVLSNLTSALQQHIAYSCKVRKYGTLLYRPNSDFKGLLQQALWKLKNQHATPVFTCTIQATEPDQGKFLTKLNSLVIDQCRSFLSKHISLSDS